jgi:hypothetical protein
MEADVPVVELGTGTGRDAMFLASRGHRLLGVDSANSSVVLATKKAEAEGIDAKFRRLNLDDRHAVLELAGDVAETMPGAHVYARFLIHAVHDQARENIWLLLSSILRAGGKAWLEFRTGKDEGQQHVFGEHFRRYLDTSQVVSEIEAAGLTLVSVEEGYGFAPFRDEDPHCARLVVASAASRP